MKLKTPSGETIDDNNFGEWKFQLTMRINFISSLDTGEIRTMDSKSDNIEVMMGSETNDNIKELFKSFKISGKIRRKNGRKQFCF